MKAIAFALAITVSPAIAAEPIIGRATVTDGDTIEIHGQRIRLFGIDAPEGGQTCGDEAGRQYRCGQTAALALDRLIASASPTRCEPLDVDRYGRIVARCFTGAVDVAEWLVSRGLAVDYPEYSRGVYGPAENRARTAKAGLWRGRFEKPWEWRRASR
ncbi:thermonuclease family protein [Flaviflagellibacter deserti]|uniref:Thermonuclease family protein n=1 Tax=Flaviflagellibacter deserti TaxID=2267266 RepID=A0ABV9Z431_9HYPH